MPRSYFDDGNRLPDGRTYADHTLEVGKAIAMPPPGGSELAQSGRYTRSRSDGITASPRTASVPP